MIHRYTKAERARLLLLDRRNRWQAGPSEVSISSIVGAYQLALRDLLELRNLPDDGKWSYATIRRLDEIRALAYPPALADGSKPTESATAGAPTHEETSKL